MALERVSIVILARDYNPSIISRDWVQQENLWKGSIDNFVHTPGFSLIEGDEFSLVVTQDRAQITLKTVSRLQPLAEFANALVKALPHTPYTAIGFNYYYSLAPQEWQLESLFVPNRERLRELLGSQYSLGARAIFRYHSFTVRFDITPSLADDEPIRVTVNFDSTVAGSDEVLACLSLYPQTTEKAQAVLEGLTYHE